MPPLDEFLQPLEKSFQEAKNRFLSKQGDSIASRLGEAPRSNDRVLISLSKKAAAIIYIINPKIIPYEVSFVFKFDYYNPDASTRSLISKVQIFIQNILYPTAQQIQQENPLSQLVFIYGSETDAIIEGHLGQLGNMPLPEIIEEEIMKQMITVPRKSYMAIDTYHQELKTMKDITKRGILSVQNIELIQSAHGYEKKID